MAEAFLLLLAAGIMLAVAVPNPRDVTLNWLRLGGIIALALVAISGYFTYRRSGWTDWVWLYGGTAVLVLGQLAFTQIAWRSTARMVALIAFAAGVAATTELWASAKDSPKWWRLTAVGVAAVTGLALMTMLLGHAYLTASKMTIRPFRRLSAFLVGSLIARIACAAGLTMYLQWRQPWESLWPLHGILIITRWTVGLFIPFIFLLMAHDCIRRRSTQSATGILYVAGVLIFIGELLALHLAQQTGLPF